MWSQASAALPFAGGTLCVALPLARTSGQVSSGTFGCTGTFSFHFSQSYMAQPSLAAGETVYAQWWMRDPGFAPPNNVALTMGLRFTLVP